MSSLGNYLALQSRIYVDGWFNDLVRTTSLTKFWKSQNGSTTRRDLISLVRALHFLLSLNWS